MEDSFDTVTDHSAIILILSANVIIILPPPKLANRYTDWEAFRKELDHSIKLNVPLTVPAQLDAESE